MKIKKYLLILSAVLALSLGACAGEKTGRTDATQTAAVTAPVASDSPTTPGASSQLPASVTREEALQTIKAQQKGMHYVEQDIDFLITQSTGVARTKLRSKALYNDDLSVKSFYSDLAYQENRKQVKYETYAGLGKIYLRQNDAAWAETSEPLEMFSTYFPMLDSFFAAEPYLEFDGSRPDSWVFQFKGKNKDLLDAFRSVYSLTFSNLDEKQLELTVSYVFDAKNAFLLKADHNISSSDKAQKDEIEVDARCAFTLHNERDAIAVPEGVVKP